MSLRTELGRVKGLGSAKEGVNHWRLQRLTAIALIPLSLWFVNGLMFVVGAPYEDAVAWIARPHVSVLLLALVIALFWHLKLGMQVVLEDYIHSPALQIATQVLLRAFAGIGALVAIVSILKISVGAN